MLLALVGCGGESKSTSTATTAAATPPPPSTYQLTQTITPATTPTQTTTTPPKPQTTSTPTSTSGGGQTPIYTQVLFTGSGGDITPATVRVPPYIAVRVELRSGDGGGYAVTVQHHQLRVDSSTLSQTVQLAGLKPGARYAVEVSGAPERLSVVANAEPGP